ncbi:MAG: HAD family hydrolase [Bdellovibrionales bacterium]
MEKLIIFDCDGVLVDSESITNQVLVDYVNEFGVGITLERALELFQGGTIADWIHYVKVEHDIELPQEFVSNFRHKMKVAFEKELEPVSGVEKLIESLNCKICIASNGPMEKMETTLRVTKLNRYFGENIYSAYQINKFKPDPSLFLHAAKEMGIEPQHCTVIEDSPRGAQAAVAAGMTVYGYDVYGKTQALIDNGALLFTKMTDLIDRIGV